MRLQEYLKQMGSAFATVTTKCYHYWRTNKQPPYIVWAETGEDESFNADNQKHEQRIIGVVDLWTKQEYDPLIDDVQDVLRDLGVTWSLASVLYEDETNLIHYQWNWGVTFVGEV